MNPAARVEPTAGPRFNEDLGRWENLVQDVETGEWFEAFTTLEEEIMAGGATQKHIKLLRNELTDPRQAAVILILSLGAERAKQVQHEFVCMKRGPTLDDHVAGMADQPKLLEYQRDHFVVKDFGGKVRVCWYSSAGEFRTRSLGSFKEAESNQTVTIDIETANGTAKKRVKAADLWLSSPTRREFNEARFMPGERPAPGLGVFNLWEGWPHHMAANPTDRIIEHIQWNLCGGDDTVFQWVMGWLADAVQNVHRTPTTALVLAGPQGSGKNVFCRLLFQLFAPHTVMITNPQQLVGNFNSHLMDKLFVFANEAFFAGNKQHANALKSLVTDDEMMVEPKGVDAFKVKKHFRLIMASNEDRVVDLDIDDRRYCVLTADAEDHNNDREYFGRLVDAWENGGEREGFLHLLHHWPLSQWDEGAIPETSARQQQREMSLPPGAKIVLDILSEGGSPQITHYCENTNRVAIRPGEEWSRTVGKYLRDAGAERYQISGTGRVWVFPPLNEARAAFAKALNLKPDWGSRTDNQWWCWPDGACPKVFEI